MVFIGPFEHHSNILPWRESCADVVQIAENAAGGLDMDDLRRNLKLYSRRCLLIGTYVRCRRLQVVLKHGQRVPFVANAPGSGGPATTTSLMNLFSILGELRVCEYASGFEMLAEGVLGQSPPAHGRNTIINMGRFINLFWLGFGEAIQIAFFFVV